MSAAVASSKTAVTAGPVGGAEQPMAVVVTVRAVADDADDVFGVEEAEDREEGEENHDVQADGSHNTQAPPEDR